jgi:cytochrome P450
MADLLTRGDCLHDFDHHGADFARDPVALTNAARARCPITYSERHGGFWHVTGYDEAFTVLQDDELFSSADGVSIPPMKKKGPPIDVDPPEHRLYRDALGAGLSRKRMASLSDKVRDWAVEAVEAVRGRGRGDVVGDIGSPVPSKAIMHLLGLPLDRWREYADVWHEVLAHPQDDAVYRSLQEVREDVFAAFEGKRGCPAHDLMSDLWASPLFDRAHGTAAAAADEWVELGGEVSMTLLGAGVDTTTNMFAQTVVWLARHPEAVDVLRDPTRMSVAVDEFFRYFTTAPALARTVTREVEVHEHAFERGDRVLVSFLGANHDPRMFDRSGEIVLDRQPNRHMAFGVGRHRCLGSNLARMVFPIMLREFLARIPDFSVDLAACEPYDDRAQVAGWVRVPMTCAVRESVA